MSPQRVAIVGGGWGAMAAAHALTAPELGGRFAVTVYQAGWRLGGKGASGRGPFGRIEEHGLHVWMGFYENAFRLIRSVYDELERPLECPLATWEDAFFPAAHVGLANSDEGADWATWSAVFPPFPGQPGDPLGLDDRNPFTLPGYLSRAAEATLALLRVAHGPARRDGPSEAALAGAGSVADLFRLARTLAQAATGLGATVVGLIELRLEVVGRLFRALDDRGLDTLHEQLARAGVEDVLRRLLRSVRDTLRRIRIPDDAARPRRRAAEVVEVLLASQLGVLGEGVLFSGQGFDVLDQYDFREWLSRYGASSSAVHSPFVRGLYSLMFAYDRGDPSRAAVAAGQMLRGCVRMFFTYRGAFFWKMRSGMGDVVFAPLYEVLKRRGVRFEFFHRLVDVELSRVDPHTLPERAEAHVTGLRFEVQAHTRGTYQPLVDVKGVPCWSAAPDWAQLHDGELHAAEGRRYESFWDRRHVAVRTLQLGHDFDFVVLAVGLGAVPHVAGQIIEREPRWQDMVRHLSTVATQALQLWCRPALDALGWDRGPITMTGFVHPFDTWADMTHLVAEESWPLGSEPGSVAYFCNVLEEDSLSAIRPEDDGFEERAKEVVVQAATRFVEGDLCRLWPRLRSAVEAGGGAFVDHRVLSGAISGATSDLLAGQFVSANVNPTDRYTLSLPGTPRFRISPLDQTFDNFTVAGDWTDSGFNLGCVEAAVMSGLLAAHALSGSPALEAIVGYDHP